MTEPAKPVELTAEEIARRLTMDPATVRKWLKAENVQPIRAVAQGEKRTRRYYAESAVAIVAAHKQERVSTKPNIDPESGLTWNQKLLKERSVALAVANEEKRRALSKEWMKVEEHYRILSAVMTRLEQIPSKMQSEAGISSHQSEILRRMHDDARSDAAKEI